MHPSVEDLIGWAIEPRGNPTVEAHLAHGCEDCEGRLREVRQAIADMRSDRDVSAPESWIHAAYGHFDRFSRDSLLARIRSWGAGLLEQSARLLTDSAHPDLAAAGFRSLHSARRFRFETGGIELDAEIESMADGVRITGQFSTSGAEPAPLADARYLVITASGGWSEGVTDRLGEFTGTLPDSTGLAVRLLHSGAVTVFEFPARSE